MDGKCASADYAMHPPARYAILSVKIKGQIRHFEQELLELKVLVKLHASVMHSVHLAADARKHTCIAWCIHLLLLDSENNVAALGAGPRPPQP